MLSAPRHEKRDENETKLYRVDVDGGFHKRVKTGMRGAPYNLPRGTRKGTKWRRNCIAYAWTGTEFLCEVKAEQGLDSVTL